MAAQPRGQACVNCRYALSSVRPQSVSDTIQLLCRRYPPGRPALGNRRPEELVMRAHDWCGEYAPANPETIDEAAMTLARLTLLGDLTAARALADTLRE